MGWNDHVEMVRRQCLACGEEGEWEIWNEVALARYSGGLDKLLGHDAEHHNRCPHCGSHEGEDVDEDDGLWEPDPDDM